MSWSWTVRCVFSHLLDEGSAGLSKGVSNNVDGGLSLGLLLGVEVDVGHFLARVEQGVLGALRQDVLLVGIGRHWSPVGSVTTTRGA